MSTSDPGRSTGRRSDQVIGGLLALIGAAALVVAVLALQHPKSSSVTSAKQSIQTDASGRAVASAEASDAPGFEQPEPTSTPTPATPSPASGDPAKAVPIVVLNSSNKSGLAQTVKETLTAAGWNVSKIGNLSQSIVSTCAYFDPADSANLLAARELQVQFPGIKRVKERFAELPKGPVVLVLTSSYTP